MIAYAITLTKVVPGESTGQISSLLEDWGFLTLHDAEKRFKSIILDPVYIRKELWSKDTDTKIKKLLMEERFHNAC